MHVHSHTLLKDLGLGPGQANHYIEGRAVIHLVWFHHLPARSGGVGVLFSRHLVVVAQL
jgi:hypothetical protein